MNVFRLYRSISLKMWLQIGICSASVLPVVAFLIIGILVAQQFTGTIAVLMLLVVVLAVALISFGTIIAMTLVQRKFDKFFTEATETCQVYRAGNTQARIRIYGNDSYAKLMTELNTVLEGRVLQRQPGEVYSQQPEERSNNTALRIIERAGRSEALASVGEVRTQYMATQLAQVARNLIDRSVFQEQASRAQAIQIFQTNEKLESLAVFVHQVTRNSQGVASLAQTGLKRILTSQETLRQTSEELIKLKQQTQQATQKVYRIGDNTDAMSHIVQLVEELAQQLTRLAQEPALQSVNEQSGEMREIVRQIQALAHLSATTTDEVARLTVGVEAGVNEAVVALQDSGREIIDKIKHVEDAGQVLEDLYRSMEFQTSMIEEIVQSSSEQTPNAEAAAAAMSQVAKVAYQSSKEMQQHSQGLKKLANLSKQLQDATTAPQALELDSLPESSSAANNKRYHALE